MRGQEDKTSISNLPLQIGSDPTVLEVKRIQISRHRANILTFVLSVPSRTVVASGWRSTEFRQCQIGRAIALLLYDRTECSNAPVVCDQENRLRLMGEVPW